MGAGRKKIELNEEQLKKFCAVMPTKEEAATFFGCSPDTIERRCKEFEGLTWKEYREKYMVDCRYRLIRRALERSKKSDVMLIFCLKNICKWSDKVQEKESSDDTKPMQMSYNFDKKPDEE